MAAAVDDRTLSPYRKLLLRLSNELIREEVEKLKLLSVDLIPRRKAENVNSGLQFFDLLEQDGRIGYGNLELLEDMFKTIGRQDIVSMIQTSKQTDLASSHDVPDAVGKQPFCGGTSPKDVLFNKPHFEGRTQERATPDLGTTIDDTDLVTDGGADDSPYVESGGGNKEDPTNAISTKPRVALVKGPGAAAMLCMNPGPVTPWDGRSHGAGQREKVVVENMPGRCEPGRVKKFQSDSALESPAVRYVDFLEYKGYAVEIIGGKHFRTPEGEFVEMKSGVQYKIHVTNMHQEGCHLDVSIDGYDVGGWVLSGSDELTIERPANESKKFTFYRVKTAPTDSGIASGRSENGLVRCVFTPEAHICVTVDVSGFQQPLQVEVPPFATVGDVKRKAQQQLNINNDPNQVIILENRRLQNEELIRRWFQSMSPPSGNLRLLAVEQEIMLEVSSGERFPLKIHPGESKVLHVMKHIEDATQVPIADQKLYYGRCRLSDSPTRPLPDDMICDPNPALVVIVPEYLHLSVKTQDGQTKPVKIDGKKTLRDLMQELRPLPREGEEVEVVFDGQCVDPYSEHRSLEDCSLKSGSVIEVKVNRKRMFSVRVRLPSMRTVNIMISPKETFKDLSKKLGMEGPVIQIKEFQLVGESKVFDPDQDTKAIEDYGIRNDSLLRVLVVNLEDERDRLNKELESRKERIDCLQAMYKDAFIERAAKTSGGSVLSFFKKVLGIGSEGKGSEGEECCHASGPDYGGPGSAKVEFFSQGLPRRNKTRLSGPDYGESGSVIRSESYTRRVTQVNPAWKAGGTTLQGYSSQLFTPAESIKVDPSRRVELLLRLVAREDEDIGIFPQEECTPLSTLYPPPVSE